ncbi:MAG: ABC transporter ATP-binding protein [Halolamina sp.]
MAELVLDTVTKRFGGVTAVDDASLRIRDGELLVLVGPSGCGKTTLLRLVAGLEAPTAGEILVDGRTVTDVPARRRDVGFVFQDLALFPHMTVRENLSFNLRMRDQDEVERRTTRTAEMLDVLNLLDRDIDELSGGQRQRVALGRALATDPELFLLDEPLSSLDAQLRDRMRTEITRLQRRLDTTMVHVTHDQQEAMTMADRVAVIKDGRIQQVGPPEKVYTRPANTFVARFFGTPPMNLLAARSAPSTDTVSLGSDGHRLQLRVPGLHGPDGQAAEETGLVVGARPEHLSLTDCDGADGIPATVDIVEYHGTDRVVYLRTADDEELVARVPQSTSPEAGTRVAVTVDTDHLHLFDPDSGERLSVEPAGTNRLQRE